MLRNMRGCIYYIISVFFIVGFLTFGVPAAVKAQETKSEPNPESGIVLTQDKENRVKIVPNLFIFTDSRCGNGQVQMMMLGTKIICGKKVSGVDIIRWYYPLLGQSDYELMYWLNAKAFSKLGFGFVSQANSGTYATFNGVHTVPLGTDEIKLEVFWQAKKGLSGFKLSPDRIDINNLKITAPIGKKLRIGPDSQFCLTQGRKAVWRIGGVADVKCGDVTLRLRHFAGNRTTPTKTQVWLILPLGGTGP